MSAWIGWQRLPHCHWHPVTEGETYDEARWHIFWVKYPGVTRELVVLPQGEHPNDIYERLATHEVHADDAEVEATPDELVARQTLERRCQDAAEVFRRSRPSQAGTEGS